MSVPRLLAVVLVIGAVLLAVVAVRTGGGTPAVPAASSAPPRADSQGVDRSTERRALQVLHAWDDRRAAAYRSGSARRLRALYAAGSTAGEADVRLLRGYRARGFTVAGLGTQLLALDVLTSRPRRLAVRVEDRVTGAVAVRGARRLRLPRDAASTRVVTLVRRATGRWRVSAVRDAAARGSPG